jgi:hypothetical protein
LVKRTLSPLPASMRTLLSLQPATTGFRTSENRLGSEKLVHSSAREKVMGTSDHQRGSGLLVQCLGLLVGWPYEPVGWVVR